MRNIFVCLLLLYCSCVDPIEKEVKIQIDMCYYESYSVLCIKILNNSSNDMCFKDLNGFQNYLKVTNRSNPKSIDITDTFFAESFYNTLPQNDADTYCCKDLSTFQYLNNNEIDSLTTLIKKTYPDQVLHKHQTGVIDNFIKYRLSNLIFIKKNHTYTENFVINNSDYQNQILSFSFFYPQKLPFERDSLFKDFQGLNYFSFPNSIKDFIIFNGELKSDTFIFKIP